jgi:hypothetical protein
MHAELIGAWATLLGVTAVASAAPQTFVPEVTVIAPAAPTPEQLLRLALIPDNIKGAIQLAARTH